MLNLNRIYLLGNVGCDPEVAPIEDGRLRVRFSLATHRKWSDEHGEHSSTDWHTVVCSGMAAQIARDRVRKGTALLIEGESHSRVWIDEDGQRHMRTEVVPIRLQPIRPLTEPATAAERGGTDLAEPEAPVE